MVRISSLEYRHSAQYSKHQLPTQVWKIKGYIWPLWWFSTAWFVSWI